MAYNNGRDNNQGQSAQLSKKEVMGPDVPALKIWNKVCETDPTWTKSFSRKGGFKGTAIHPMYNARKASEVFGGPCGSVWGFTELETKIENGAASVLGEQGQHLVYERIWFSKVALWYFWEVDGKKVKCEVVQWGATTMVQKSATKGWESDEEAAKKSFTDASSKCLSLLGFGADIHMGLYDDNKYVNDLKARIAEEAERQVNQNGGGGNGGGYEGDQGGQGQGSGRQQGGNRSGNANQGGQGTTGGAGGGGQSAGGGAHKGGQQMSPDLINLLQAIEKGIPTADAVPLLEKLFSVSKLEANIAAVAFLKRKIEQASEVKHLEVLSRRQKQLLDNGYINQAQHQEIIQLAEAKWDELDPPKNKIAS